MPWKVLAGSLKALVVIQASYDLDTVKLMDGLDETGRENLGLDDLVNLCDMAYKYNLLNSAVDFLRAALVWIRRHPQKEGSLSQVFWTSAKNLGHEKLENFSPKKTTKIRKISEDFYLNQHNLFKK